MLTQTDVVAEGKGDVAVRLSIDAELKGILNQVFIPVALDIGQVHEVAFFNLLAT